MTIIVAVSDGVSTAFIGADTAMTNGTNKAFNNIGESKIVKFPNFYVGYAGEARINEVLLRMLESREISQDNDDEDITEPFQEVKNQWLTFEINNKLDAADFGMAVYQGLKSRSLVANDDNLELCLLIVTKDCRMFQIEQVDDVREVKDFTAIGCGSDPAMGALLAFRQTFQDEDFYQRDTVHEAMDIACLLKEGCCRPLEVLEVKCAQSNITETQ